MTDERRAELLARWLEESASGPVEAPEALEPEVVEALFALRPDLATAPALTAEDILASVTEGPLAADPAPDGVGGPSTGKGEGDVLVFPSGGGGPTRSPWRRFNRWGGLGVVVATAATLLLVALPVLQSSAPDPADAVAGSPAAPMEEQKVAEPAAAPPAAAGRPTRAAPRPRPAPLPTAPRPSAPPPPAAPPPPRQEQAARGAAPDDLDAVAVLDSEDAEDLEEAYLMDDQVAAGSGPLIPELESAERDKSAPLLEEQEPAARTVVEDTRAQAEEARTARIEEERTARQAEARRTESAPKEEKRAASKPRAKDSRSSRNDLPGASAPAAPAPASASEGSSAAPVAGDSQGEGRHQAALNAAQAIARAGEPARAAASLEPWIRPPAQVGQEVALQAARYYLDAGDAQAAERVARRGLELAGSSARARRALLEVLGTALHEQGDATGAAEAWKEARGR